MSASLGAWFFQAALWMSRRNGRSLAQRLIAQGKRYPPEQLEKVLREQLGPLGAGMEPQAQERLTAEAVAAAKQWLRRAEAAPQPSG